MKGKFILVVDQGTTSTRALIFDEKFSVVATSRRGIEPLYPHEGWVEQDPQEILKTVDETVKEVISKSGIDKSRIAVMGLTNQRETTIAWRKSTGEPLYNAIVWQCRRTASRCSAIKDHLGDTIKNLTGLTVDPYFSATKMEWLLKNVDSVKQAARENDLLMGTVDAFLTFHLLGRAVTDVSNASRTMLFDIEKLQWSDELLEIFGVKKEFMVEVVSTSENLGITRYGFPLASIVGDQQGALFGQRCFEKGDVKCTYGTGAFALMNTGEKRSKTSSLLSTIAWKIGSKPVVYAIEGSIFNCGTVIDWLRDNLELFEDFEELNAMLRDGFDSSVYFVPALTGLGAPHWDPSARGLFIGLNRSTTKRDLVVSGVKGVIYSVQELFETMEKEAGLKLRKLRVDGGVALNDRIMRLQANVTGTRVIRPRNVESTAKGAAMLAAIAMEFCSMDELKDTEEEIDIFEPERFDPSDYIKWKEAVERSKNWMTLT